MQPRKAHQPTNRQASRTQMSKFLLARTHTTTHHHQPPLRKQPPIIRRSPLGPSQTGSIRETRAKRRHDEPGHDPSEQMVASCILLNQGGRRGKRITNYRRCNK
ncbi:hypothetical protein IF1G_03297 [Cordyceps javanica]|uniref:Uncharacterized protein n=1 Tax=Cordyceps javanica TaxID=43265 RepID=A0A545V771_9HYPO|nr:hypothetical protein IF1G_03297 [Cordyceps javanica]